ncbi:MAG TPA: hypothetical protein VNH45_07350 [Gaiellaceae bacterium]|jgi:hypothetical protein|nr:hypothetical protein [Gaiellaceae bacterium]
MLRSAISVAAMAVALGAPSVANAPAGGLHFRVLAATGIRLADVTWTGDRILYVENTTNAVWSAPPTGNPLTPFATMPKQVEETRCRVSPGTHGWQPGLIFCHAPGNTIYRISADGKTVTAFAKLPEKGPADGALAFDYAGAFGYGLVAATGRSGTNKANGGNVYAIGKTGVVRRIGHYAGPGGADEVEIAPAGFARAALLTVDLGPSGQIVAMSPAGKATVIARLPDGPNPIAAIVPSAIRGGDHAGLYVTDTLSKNAYFAPASDLQPYAGDVIVGTELKGLFWAIKRSGGGYAAMRIPTTLRGAHYNLEGMAYVSR